MAIRVSKDQLKDNEKEQKHQYRILNWKDYHQSLINRGRLTFWFEDSVISEWYTLQGHNF